MSRSNAAAINRRVNVPATQSGNNLKSANTLSVQPSSQPSGLTLPQVINVIDNRLVVLEKFMRETKQNPGSGFSSTNEINIQEKTNFNTIENVSVNDFNNIINEFNSRFELFAQEISEIKDIVLKLQSYTMDVNKTLLEEREQLFSNTITNDEILNTNADTETDNNNILDNTSIDLNNLIQQEFSQN
jgi:glutaredoxin-related protein